MLVICGATGATAIVRVSDWVATCCGDDASLAVTVTGKLPAQAFR